MRCVCVCMQICACVFLQHLQSSSNFNKLRKSYLKDSHELMSCCWLQTHRLSDVIRVHRWNIFSFSLSRLEVVRFLPLCRFNRWWTLYAFQALHKLVPLHLSTHIILHAQIRSLHHPPTWRPCRSTAFSRSSSHLWSSFTQKVRKNGLFLDL